MAPTRPASESPRTQEERILWLLHAAWPEWTPAPVLARISLQYGARIFSLRRKGWKIANKVETKNGVKHGSFRLATPGTFPNPNKEAAQAVEKMCAIAHMDAPVNEAQARKLVGVPDKKVKAVTLKPTLFSQEEMINFQHDAKFYPS
jgi:hypothetical protein